MPGFSLRGQDAWRNHPMLANGFKRPIPNFPLACGIFVGLVAVDWAYRAINGTYDSLSLFLLHRSLALGGLPTRMSHCVRWVRGGELGRQNRDR
jgi:hypothetical protein